jgi:predicted kinase
MAKLALTKPTLILLYGLPGSGKSFIARQLTEHIQAAHVHGDRIRAELFDNPQFDDKETSTVQHVMDYMTNEYLQAGLSVIYDGNSNRAGQRRIFRNMASKNGADTLIIWAQIDIESAFTRVATRDRRRSDDKYAQPLDRTGFDALTTRMQNPNGENYVVVSGKHVFSTQLSAIVKRLREMNLVDAAEADKKIIKPGLINLVPNPAAGRVDMSRRNINIR